MKQCVLAIDLGTTNIKGILYDLDGKQVRAKSYAVKTEHPSPDISEQDPEEILQHVLKLVEQALSSDNIHLLGIGFSTAVQSFIAVGANGVPLTQNSIWSDRRSEQYSNKLTQSPFGGRFFELTGNPVYPSLTGCKFQWFRENRPLEVAALHKIVSIKEYVIFKLAGEWAVDYSTASATGLMDIHKLEWSTEVLAYFEMDESLLSPLVDVTHQIPLQPLEDFSFSLPYTVPIILGGSDGCLANLGVGAITPGKAALTIGTSGAVRVASKRPYIDPKQRLFCYYLYKNVYIIGGAANTGAATYHWFMEAFGKETDPKAISESVSEIQKTVELPIFLPYLKGERAPIWDANAKGIFYGITAEHSLEDFRLAVLQGIFYSMRNIAQTIEESGAKIDSLLVNGGFLKPNNIAQKLADVTNKNVIKSTEQASAFGAFLIVLLSLKKFNILDDIQSFISKGDVFNPNPENVETHTSSFECFLRLQKSVLRKS